MTLQQPHLLIKHVETVERNDSQRTDEADILLLFLREKNCSKLQNAAVLPALLFYMIINIQH